MTTQTVDKVEIADRRVGPGEPAYIIAEAGVNHDGQIEKAFALVDAAVNAGADAVKFQNFNADELLSRDSPKPSYQVENTGQEQTQYDMLEELELGPGEVEELVDYCEEEGIEFLCTPYDPKGTEVLREVDVPAFKIASCDIVNKPLLESVKGTKPVILSTGASYMGEIEEALDVLGDTPVILLHCVTDYPCAPEDVNLRTLETMRNAFPHPIGYSDHSEGVGVPVGAVSLGAVLIEKHLTLDKTAEGPDHAASAEPDELRAMVEGIRKAEAAMGRGVKQPTPSEADMREKMRRRLVYGEDIQPGTRVTRDHLKVKRPGTPGVSPMEIDRIEGTTLRAKVTADDPVRLSDLEFPVDR